MSKSRVYICSWDNLGFETIVDMTAWERQSLLDTMAGKELSRPPINMQSLMLRAKFNPQRNPEIWSFNTVDEITEDDLWELANNNPQELADLIRKHGKKLYGYAGQKPLII